jgi:adenylate cyclase
MSCQEARVRRIARIQPRGLNEPQMLYELLPPEGSGCQISDRGLYVFETAVEAWMAGDWNEAHAVFQELAPEDPTARAICDRYLTRQSPPADWRGFLIDGTE